MYPILDTRVAFALPKALGDKRLAKKMTSTELSLGIN